MAGRAREVARTAAVGATLKYNAMSTVETCDVLIIGGGPGGSSAATFLARQGRRVILLDKDRHPRFHIGESLLPANVPLFDRLGVTAKIAAIGMSKFGVRFVSPQHEHSTRLSFADAWDGSLASSFQVRRSDFDHLLLQHAAEAGADVREGWRVREVDFVPDFGGGSVVAQADDGSQRQIDARFIIDASGRDTFLANRFQSKARNPRHASAAIFAHYEDVPRGPGSEAGDITIYWFDHGWFWVIPLHDGITSVGVVCWPYYLKSRRGVDLDQFFADTVALCPRLAERMAGARQARPAEATGNYSYASRVADGGRTGQSFCLVGDAFAFIDPVFSSGVYLAMSSAEMAAEAVGRCLDEPARAGAALAKYGRTINRGPRAFSWFIYRVTNPAMRDLFMYPRNELKMRQAVLSVLAGDIYRGTPYGQSLLAFKGVYYVASLLNPLRTWRSWRRRQVNIQDPQSVN